jgi:hypothetical protein
MTLQRTDNSLYNLVRVCVYCNAVMRASAGANMHTLLEVMQQGLLQARSSPGKQATSIYRKYD